MTSEALDSLKSFFLSLWTLLGSVYVPATSLTLQHLLVAPLGAVVFITVLKKILDIGAGDIRHGISIGMGDKHYPISNNKGQED